MPTNDYELLQKIHALLGIDCDLDDSPIITIEPEPTIPLTGILPEIKSENLINRFPDAYCKLPNSNNEKLLKLLSVPLTQIRKTIRAVYDSNDIFKATGKTLDYYGDIYNVQRGRLNDTQYRYMILSAIARNNVGGDYESILEAISVIFHCDKNEVKLSDHEDNPATIRLDKMPFSVIMEAGFSTTQAVALIENLLPITVGIEAGNFEGTFEFGEEYTDYDENKGFSDSNENPTVGGYFGLFYGEESLFGSFEFDEPNVYDDSAGFGDEEQTTGGELGQYYGLGDYIPI